MRNAKIFSGSSHPFLAQAIASELNTALSPVTVKRFPNQEISVSFGCSVRDQYVYIIQSGSIGMNDNIMELLIMIRAARMNCAKKITVIMPYFPYSKQSKKKKHRGAIVAKLVADMLSVAGIDHVITLDLHAYQISGFFTCPLDNLFSRPTIASWIISNVPDYKNAVVVSKNAGGAKRVTSLADSLGLDFAIIYVDAQNVKRSVSRAPSVSGLSELPSLLKQVSGANLEKSFRHAENLESLNKHSESGQGQSENEADSDDSEMDKVADEIGELDLRPIEEIMNESDDDMDAEDESQINSQVDQDYSSPRMGNSTVMNKDASHTPSETPIGHKKNSTPLTLIGDVKNRLVFLMDDLIDSTRSFLNVAEYLVTKCGAKEIYILASHGLFSEISLTEIEICPYVQRVVSTNSYPIPNHVKAISTKLVHIDVSHLLAEAIRRNHNGESVSMLFDKVF
ncbi:Ribose-phosphate pyrophosphokinase 1 [Zancudomyces culisetae]|uniref:ribose-phosphate diphosphokinase n=1 Tax=Zancudomyces culisetae TaxID=1213189 RepID=A0A1R1PYG4_ZANCU|nr:Ribose-phosphate pyrophosphokinase 1 [Zancudomyces culisetae]|eukprot:OMH85996.1 Ribose-phosphate pyrophosphokinase 1 [Zancudomyces culisetae]